MYGLVALGLNLQYGIARMMNLSYGEFFMGSAFAAYFTIILWKYNPLLSIFISAPIAFVVNWLIYRYLMVPAGSSLARPGCARCRRGPRHLRADVRVRGVGA